MSPVEHDSLLHRSFLEVYELLVVDARLLVVAGSDSTVATTSHLFYELGRRPWLQQSLFEELKGFRQETQAYKPCMTYSTSTRSSSVYIRPYQA